MSCQQFQSNKAKIYILHSIKYCNLLLELKLDQITKVKKTFKKVLILIMTELSEIQWGKNIDWLTAKVLIILIGNKI